MKKSIQRLGILAISASLLMACGNDSNKKSVKTGTTTFFHYVTGSSTLSLESESNNRGLGTVNFQNFGPGITLAAKTWDLTVTDLRDETDGSDDVLVLENATFPVTRNIRTIHALIGDYDIGNVELVSLPLGYDDDFGSTADKNADGIADTKSIYINISSIYQDTLKVYLASPACQNLTIDKLETDCPAGSLYMEEVDFKESTASIRLKENTNKYYLRIASSANPAVEIYNSGEQLINDALEQTIIIAPYAGAVNTGSRITAFYFANAKGTKWLAADSKGQIRVLNALKDSADLNFLLDNVDIPSIDALFHKGFGALSSYVFVDTKHVAYSLLFDEATDNTPFASVLEPIINVQDGQSWTVIPFGRIAGGVDTKSAVIVLEEDAVFSNKATLTVSNAGYVADENLRKPYNVHITIPNEPVNSDSVDIPLLGYADYGTATVNAGNTYKVSITDELNKSNKATPVLVNVEGGENLHFVLMEKVLGGGFEIKRLIGDAAVERTSIAVSSATASVSGTPVTITVTLKDIGGNKLADSTGNTVTLTASSATVVLSAVTNNGNGTYTATITNTVAEAVIISGKLDGNDIADTATVTFN